MKKEGIASILSIVLIVSASACGRKEMIASYER